MTSGISHATRQAAIMPYYRAAVAFTILWVVFFLPLVVFIKGAHPALIMGPVVIGVAVIDAGIIILGRREGDDIGDTLSFTVPLGTGNVQEAYAAKIGQLESYLKQRKLSFTKNTAPNPKGPPFLPDARFELPGYCVTAKVRHYAEQSVTGARIIIGRVSDPPIAGHLKLADDLRQVLQEPEGYTLIISGLEPPGHSDRNQ